MIFISQKEPVEAPKGSPCTLHILNVITRSIPISHHSVKQGLFRKKTRVESMIRNYGGFMLSTVGPYLSGFVGDRKITGFVMLLTR